MGAGRAPARRTHRPRGRQNRSPRYLPSRTMLRRLAEPDTHGSCPAAQWYRGRRRAVFVLFDRQAGAAQEGRPSPASSRGLRCEQHGQVGRPADGGLTLHRRITDHVLHMTGGQPHGLHDRRSAARTANVQACGTKGTIPELAPTWAKRAAERIKSELGAECLLLICERSPPTTNGMESPFAG